MSNDLLKPRYKVIADYPKSVYNVGDIINAGTTSEDCIYCDREGPRMRHYPHLFKKLEWHEERKPNEMPEFLKCLSPVFKWSKGDIIKVGKWIECFGPSVRFYTEYTDKVTHSPSSFLPATLAEYEAYLQTLTVK